MKTDFLETFLLTADTGSMAEAARRLDMTAAAVARQLRSLESEIGAPLVRRAGKTVRVTEAGHRLLERSRALVLEVGRLKALANLDEIGGELRLGSINTAMDFLVPETVARLLAAHPGLRIHIRSALSAELFEAVRQEQVDAAVCLYPQFALPKTFVWRLLREESLVALAPARFAGRDPHELLREQPFIRYDRNQWGGQQVDRYLRAAGIAPRERIELSKVMTIVTLVARGLGVAIVPHVIMPPDIRPQIVVLPLPLPHKPRQLGVLWRRASIREKLIRAFVGQIKSLSLP
ncbi:MAG: LysR family transcriptional regulator [Candidatus Accumulibacter sp.]|jgi:DNA-binding transcriptional LysR family regulator|nr:LysR family transcriptional regulator [Accumulibacter sp.]